MSLEQQKKIHLQKADCCKTCKFGQINLLQEINCLKYNILTQKYEICDSFTKKPGD